MNAIQILNKNISLVTPNMHVTRRKSLLACISSLLSGSSATVTKMGRGINSSASEKHRIKRADRLLSNTTLGNELSSIYCLMTRLFTSAVSRPVISIDWSDLDTHKSHFLLRASLAFDGRSLTLFEEVHGLKTKEKPITHETFLMTLKSMLPTNSRPIIVTDAGFKTPWFNMVIALGWDYVGRARKPNFYHNGDEQWQCISTTYLRATSRAKAFAGEICRYQPFATRFVLYKQKALGRHMYNRNGEISRAGTSIKSAKRNKEPWLLVTSLPIFSGLAKKVVAIYKTRMQIEETFRDMKSQRYGLGYALNLSKNINRIRILILLTTLTAMVAIIIGLVVTTADKHRQYQANSIKHRRVLSYHFVGLRAFVDDRMRIKKAVWRAAINQLKEGLENAITAQT